MMRWVFLSLGVLIVGACALGGDFLLRQYRLDQRQTQALIAQQQQALQAGQKALEAAEQQILTLQTQATAESAALQSKIATVQSIADRAANKKSDNDYTAIISEWKNRVGQILCFQPDGSQVKGSATIATLVGYGLSAITNAHVTTDTEGNAPRACFIGIGGLGARQISSSETNQQFFNFLAQGLDVAYVRMSTPISASDNNAFETYGSSRLKVCSGSDVNIGDKIVILGYPRDGSPTSITATQGVISGFDGNFYVTDAKIDHGNSGGAAILMKDDCWLGMPSAAVVGSIESYGRILKGSLTIGM